MISMIGKIQDSCIMNYYITNDFEMLHTKQQRESLSECASCLIKHVFLSEKFAK